MKETAVEFLQESLSIHLSHQQQMQFEGLFQQAKEMEKEQMCEFAKKWDMELGDAKIRSAESCFDETFNTKER